ncbi:adenylyltransferase/cytidyltransferase family protein [Lachnospiraceae bacterium 54-11]
MGGVKGVWVRIEPECIDFYKKYAYIKQTGYSIVDWLTNYYGQNVIIGIHSYSEYTELLLQEIEDSDISIKFICQSGGNLRGYKGNIIEKSFTDISQEEIQVCDLIINTFISLKMQVRYLYSKYCHFNKVISLYDIVDELYSYEKDAGYMLRVASNIAASGRKVYVFDYPKLAKQSTKSQRESQLLNQNLCWNNMLNNLLLSNDKENLLLAEEIIMPALNKARTKETQITFEDYRNYFPSILPKNIAPIKYVGNYAVMYDLSSKYVNIRSGMRITVSGKEPIRTKKIHFWGKSWVYGLECADGYTLPSFVQKIIDEGGLDYKVYNHGIPGIPDEIIANLMYDQNEMLPKDEIFVLVHMFAEKIYSEKAILGCDYINKLSSERPSEYGEIWVDSAHIGEDGSELLARQIVDAIIGKGKIVPKEFRNKFNPNAGKRIYKYKVKDQVSLWADSADFQNYKKYIEKHKQRNGAIVMNCNPFTLGHRYLIETAAKQCDRLYIFVVEEDKSVFPFADRLSLVKQGTADIENVVVLYSGHFIISAMTFPGYFNKSADNKISVDTSNDLLFFAKYVAPVLGINVRYVGEEPLDNVTKQYNENMKETLPQYGIDFVEMPRKRIGEDVISASRVRKLLNEERIDEIAEIVPKTTLEYLRNRIGKKFIDTEK